MVRKSARKSHTSLADLDTAKAAGKHKVFFPFQLLCYASSAVCQKKPRLRVETMPGVELAAQGAELAGCRRAKWGYDFPSIGCLFACWCLAGTVGMPPLNHPSHSPLSTNKFGWLTCLKLWAGLCCSPVGLIARSAAFRYFTKSLQEHPMLFAFSALLQGGCAKSSCLILSTLLQCECKAPSKTVGGHKWSLNQKILGTCHGSEVSNRPIGIFFVLN